jgi:hypothetical protein
MRIIDIRKELVPYEFDIELNSKLYTFLVKYNQECDFYTVDLRLGDEVVVEGEKIVYGSVLFDSVNHLDVPKGIMALDISGESVRVGKKELGEKVFLYLIGDLYV